jgi:FKBP-type peptidyl-prolyl cis-trans isomerase 2
LKVKKGDTIKVEYTGTLEDGTVFDASDKHEKPLEFEVGAGMIIKGFDEAVIDMEKGEEKEITLQPSEAYGEPNPDLVKKVPKDKMPKDPELKPGMMIGMQLPNGQQIPAVVKEVDDEAVTIDLNPPLAGKVLKFKIKILDIIE